jgi:small subunit ribosomal protein S1
MTAPENESFADLFKAEENKKLKKLKPGQKVGATIVNITQENTFLDVGTKSEGVIRTAELTDETGAMRAQVGDRIELYFLGTKGGEQLFTAAIGSGASAAHLEEAYHSQVPVTGRVKAEIKGGFEITLSGNVRGFCPFSQMGLHRVQDSSEYLDQEMTFLITRFEANGRNLVLSARAIQEREREEQREKLQKTLAVGQVVEGTVSSIRDFGAFVDLGGADGLIPLSEIGWSRVDNADEYFSVGQIVKAVVKSIDWDKNRISLSYKETQKDPWDEVVEQLLPGSSHQGKVVRLAQFGAFVNLAPGVDGLVHISKLGSGRRINHPREVLEEGQLIDVTIESIEREEKRISLTPADYVSPESKEEEEQREYTSFKKQQTRKDKNEIGSLGALLQAKLAEKKK